MKIHTLYQAPVRRADLDETLAEAADRMSFYEVGALVVFDGEKMAGIITERDLVRALSLGEDPARTLVSRYMTAAPSAVSLRDDVKEAAEMMFALGTRHLPVVDDGDVVGMISARDLLGASTVGSPARNEASSP